MTHADEKGEGFNGFSHTLIGLSLARQRGLCENGEPYYYYLSYFPDETEITFLEWSKLLNTFFNEVLFLIYSRTLVKSG